MRSFQYWLQPQSRRWVCQMHTPWPLTTQLTLSDISITVGQIFLFKVIIRSWFEKIFLCFGSGFIRNSSFSFKLNIIYISVNVWEMILHLTNSWKYVSLFTINKIVWSQTVMKSPHLISVLYWIPYQSTIGTLYETLNIGESIWCLTALELTRPLTCLHIIISHFEKDIFPKFVVIVVFVDLFQLKK